MKKISQAIIGATLILDVAVVFTFGLAVISSFEDGSRLPETTFVRRPIERQVAGTTACPATASMFIKLPTSGSITSQVFRMSTGVNGGANFTASTSVFFVYVTNVSPYRKETQAMHQMIEGGTSLPFPYNSEWVADIDILRENIPIGPFTFHAEGRDAMGNCIAKSVDSTIDINFIPPPMPAVSIILSDPGSTLSGAQATIIGEITNLPPGTQIQDALIKIFNNGTQVAGPFPAPALSANNYLMRQSIFNSTALNGVYDVKMFVHYAGIDGLLKIIESAQTTVNIDNSSTTSTNTSYNQNANSGADTNSGTNYNSNTSNTSTPAANTNVSTSTSGTNTNGTTSTNTSPGTNTATTMTAAIISPSSSTILRSRDNPLAAKTSAAISGLRFIIHKSGEPVTQFIPIDAASSDKINWKANMSLMKFNDGDYDITAVSGDIKSDPVKIVVQRFSSNWHTPSKGDELSKKAVLRTEINGIYGIDNKIPINGIVVEFWQVSVTSSYPPKYIGRAQKKPDSHEWFYEWNTTDSRLGECRLEVRIGNSVFNTIKGSLYNTEPLLVKVSNQISSALLSDSSNSNVNKNSNTTSIVNTNISNIDKVTNTSINSSTGSNQNSNLNSAQDLLNQNVSVIDTDNDGLSDEKEAQLGTNSNSNDTDGDGLFDREETEVHGTNPLNVDTDGDGYNDFEEIQSGHNPLKPPSDPTSAVLTKPKPIEEPKNVEKPILETLVVEKIENKEIKTTPPPSANDTNSQASTSETTENTIVLKGKGPANTILTLFIYSVDPLVITVKTDDDGNWEYELDKKLEDGEHELYVTVTDDTGKIQSQSNPIAFFVKEAKAVSPENYRADLAAREPVKTSSTDIYLIASIVLVLIAAIAGLAVALRRKSGI